jgi:pheromone receptor transcription factor
MNPNQIQPEDPIIKQDEDLESGEESDVKPSRRSGRRKIKIEYIEDKNRRHITFSKRKAGIMKKVKLFLFFLPLFFLFIYLSL